MQRLDAKVLARRTDSKNLDLGAVAPGDAAPSLIGHDRAAKAIQYALNVALPGYNLFVMGPIGIGKSRFVREAIDRRSKPSPQKDWVYVNNFADPGEPKAIGLDAGDGVRFRTQVREFISELKQTIPAAFEAEAYATDIKRLQAELNVKENAALKTLSDEAGQHGVGLVKTDNGVTLAPINDGEVVSPEQFQQLTEQVQERLRTAITKYEEQLQQIMRDGMRRRRDQVAVVRDLNRKTTGFAVDPSLEALRERYQDYPSVLTWLSTVQEDLLENFSDFLPASTPQPATPFANKPDLGRFEVNVLTESKPGQAQVIRVDHPTVAELLGRVDAKPQFGTLLSDHRMIRPGKLHAANGGYLLIDAWRLFSEPFAWDALKRALQRRSIRIESAAEAAGGGSPARLEPEAIALDVKVILFGERYAYYSLAEHDADFDALFRVVADFDDDLPRDDKHQSGLVRVIQEQVAASGLLPLNADGMARLLDESVRLADDCTRFSSRVQYLIELAVEADYVARAQQATAIDGDMLRTAIASRRDRLSRGHFEQQRSILRGTLLIDTDGTQTAQINGLAVYEMGGESFGVPSRITATTRAGDGSLMDIQRETHMGGAIHTKGVMILASYLGSRYAARQSFAVNASLVFEQSYGPVDGDSATLAEVCALLSSLTSLPARQDLAITGSMNQLGEAQAIGGVNHKIEGFFGICKARGLTGTQGVIIPRSNVDDLMLDEEIVEAVDAGNFHIYAVSQVDEAIELLLGTRAGQVGDGPQHSTVAGKVQQRLTDYQTQRGGGRAAARRLRYSGADRD